MTQKSPRVQLKDRLMSVQEVADALEVTTLTIYRWRARQGLPSSRVDMRAVGAYSSQKYLFRASAVTHWLRDNRPELMPLWNGEDAPVVKAHAWTRRRLREVVRSHLAA